MRKCKILALLLVCGIVFGYYQPARGAAQAVGSAASSVQPESPPQVIWVSDFDLDSADMKGQQGVLGSEGPLAERRQHMREALGRRPTAAGLVDELSRSLTEDLKNQSLPAKRLVPGQPMPTYGWVIRGQFLEVDEGNRVRRAVIGFGSGATSMEIEVLVTDLETNPSSPFLLVGTQADSGKMPGAIVTMNPYVAAAKFVMAKNASEKDVRATARKIAAEIVTYMKGHGLMPPGR
jgi:hypothetical protein